MAALLLRGELIFKVHAGGAGFDEGLHDLEAIERTAEAGFRVRDDRREVIDVALAFERLNLIDARKGVVDALYERGGAVGRIQALIGIGLAGQVGVGGNLPARQVNRLAGRL